MRHSESVNRIAVLLPHSRPDGENRHDLVFRINSLATAKFDAVARAELDRPLGSYSVGPPQRGGSDEGD